MSNYSRIVKEVNKGSLFDSAKNLVNATISWNQGDMLYFDNADDLLKPVASNANCTGFVGIADYAIVSGKPVSPYQGTAVDAAQAISEIPGPVYGVVARVTLTTGESINPGDLVYATGPQIVSVSGTKAVGVYQGPAVATAPAGTQVEVLLGHRYPADTLVIS